MPQAQGPPDSTVAFLATAAAIKTAVGIGSLIVAVMLGMDSITPRYWLLAAHAAAFGAAGLMLVGGGSGDSRARLLGAASLLVASTFSIRIGTPLHERVWPLVEVTRGLLALRLDALLPYLLWCFAREFPRASEAPHTRWGLAIITRTSLVLGVLFLSSSIIVSIAATWPALRTAWPSLVGVSLRLRDARLYWPVLMGLTSAALPMIVWRAQRASLDERRRVRLLAAGLFVGTLPAIVWILITETVPGAVKWLPLDVVGWVAYPALLSTPFTIAYAVLVRQALDVRLMARGVIRYTVTRNALAAALSLPAVGLLASLYQNRPVTSPSGMLVLVLLLLGVASWRWRTPLLDAIDRHFFRPQYDAKLTIGDLVTRCARTDDVRELAQILSDGITEALAPMSVHVLLRAPGSSVFVAPEGGVEALSASSAIVSMLTASTQAIDTELEQPSGAVADLVVDERHWLADAGARLLVPLHQPHGQLLGFLVLGEKLSTDPYTASDRALLQNTAAAATMAIVAQRSNVAAAGPAIPVVPSDRVAAECVAKCGAINPPDSADCAVCGAGTTEAMVPQIVHDKFFVQRRIGSGGSGIVYRAVDTRLDRVVAIKTLRSVISPGESMLLQREAQSMAKVTHQNLATIFGAETWHGRPMLIVEYLAGGTLTDRLREGPLPPNEAIDVVVALAVGLAEIHRSGLVHGDVKPSNIGFTATETVKLLDFGLARLTTVAGATEKELLPVLQAAPGTRHNRPAPEQESVSCSALVGTPRYMSPERLHGADPLPRDDVWSLAVVLYETIFGVTPFAEVRGVPVLNDEQYDVRQLVPSASKTLAALFRRCFSSSAERRPQSANEFHAELRTLLVEDTRANGTASRDRTHAVPPNSMIRRPQPATIAGQDSPLSRLRRL